MKDADEYILEEREVLGESAVVNNVDDSGAHGLDAFGGLLKCSGQTG